MKHFFLLLALALPIGLWAQSDKADAKAGGPPTPATLPAAPADLPEEDRLMQEYMARRVEWIKVRAAGQAAAKSAKNDTEKKTALKKAEDDERALRAASADLAKRLGDLHNKKTSEGRPGS